MFKVLAPIGKAVRAFFKSDLKLRRGDSGLQLVFEETVRSAEPRGKRGKGQPDAASEREKRDFERMTASLTALLDQMPENRTVLRHLVFIEHALQRKGARALYKVPYDVLKHALQQFEGVVVNWSDDGLACLRSKMAVAVIDRERNDKEAEATATTAVIDSVVRLAEPVTLTGDEAAEAEAALLAAYGSVQLPGLEAAPAPSAKAPALPERDAGDDERPSQFEVQGELASPSARSLVKSAKAQALKEKVDLRLRELQQ